MTSFGVWFHRGVTPRSRWDDPKITARWNKLKTAENSRFWLFLLILFSLVMYIMAWKWNESGFRPPLCTYRLNWARRTSWGWWDDWDDTAEHATSRSRRLPTILIFTRGWGRNICVSFKPPRPGTEPRALAWKAAVLTTTLGPPPILWLEAYLDPGTDLHQNTPERLQG